MFMEMDGDEIAITYIKDVTFNTNLPDVEILKMTKVGFCLQPLWIHISQTKTLHTKAVDFCACENLSLLTAFK